MKSEIEKNFVILEKWLSTKGFILFRTKHKKVSDEVDFDKNIVFINTRSTLLHQFYSTLHECGHIIVRKKKNYQEKYKASIKYNESFIGNMTLRASIEEIEEEINAWREGEALCKKLKISLDTDKYYTYSARWVMGYVVKAGLGKDYLLGSGNSTEKSPTIKIEKLNIKLEEPVDNETEVCYNSTDSKPETKDQ